jgi:hypothetical protein
MLLVHVDSVKVDGVTPMKSRYSDTEGLVDNWKTLSIESRMVPPNELVIVDCALELHPKLQSELWLR